MTDEEIRAFRRGWDSVQRLGVSSQVAIALADEALRRGAQLQEVCERLCENHRLLLWDPNCPYCALASEHERSARLEAALEIASSIIANGCDGRINWQADAVRWRHDYQDLVKPCAALEEKP